MKALPIPSGQNEGIGNAFKALPMPSGKDEGTANFPYQILLVEFHLQYRNERCLNFNRHLRDILLSKGVNVLKLYQ